MRLHARRAEFSSIAGLRNRLVREIADIGAAPTPQTLHLADNLLAGSPPHKH
jgi:hypothetical protein